MAERDLSALLSQVLVAFTVEFDNEFERRMGEAGYQGASLSLMIWENLLRFLADGAKSVRELAALALSDQKTIKFELGCLERWRFVVLAEGKREGWGSGRGIRADSMARLSTKGLRAATIWPPLFPEIEERWKKRFGVELRESLQQVAQQLEFELPEGLTRNWDDRGTYPPRGAQGVLPLASLLSRLLLTFRLEFDSESSVPLSLCANTLRVLSEKPIPEREIPLLTGASPETCGLGWQLKPFVIVTADPAAKRGKVVRLSERGLKAQERYRRLIVEIEERWEKRYGKEVMRHLRESLQAVFERLPEGLVPPPGTQRAGELTPALGRKDIGVAARQRMRDMVMQTEAFVRNPAAALPHYPLWDMNRGFGP